MHVTVADSPRLIICICASDIFKTLEQPLNTNSELNPLTALFGLPPNGKLA